jgi:hypothetical protein
VTAKKDLSHIARIKLKIANVASLVTHSAASSFDSLARNTSPVLKSSRLQRKSDHALLRAPGSVISGLARPVVSLIKARAMLNVVRARTIHARSTVISSPAGQAHAISPPDWG